MGITFKYKNYRIQGPEGYTLVTLATDEFIRRFLLHVLPTGFHRIRHYGLFASAVRAHNIAHAREFLAAPIPRRQASASLYLVTAKTLNELPHPVSPVAVCSSIRRAIIRTT